MAGEVESESDFGQPGPSADQKPGWIHRLRQGSKDPETVAEGIRKQGRISKIMANMARLVSPDYFTGVLLRTGSSALIGLLLEIASGPVNFR